MRVAPIKDSATETDYWALPNGRRAELVDGVLYDMTPPGRVHQRLVGELTVTFGSHIRAHGGSCHVYPAPFAVNLDGDGSTWVEPDLSVVCDPTKLSDRGCEGAPDLVIEVVSPSSQRMDYLVKAVRYADAGVREYWIVDPRAEATLVYRFASGSDAPVCVPFDQVLTSLVLPGVEVCVAEML